MLKPQPQAIPTELFRAWAVGRVDPSAPSTRKEKLLPDFRFEAVSDVPLPDNPGAAGGRAIYQPFPPELSARVRISWDFGDGQSSEETNPFHVYLRPGLYSVKLTVTRGSAAGNDHRILVDQPIYGIRRRAQAQTQASSFCHASDSILAVFRALT